MSTQKPCHMEKLSEEYRSLEPDSASRHDPPRLPAYHPSFSKSKNIIHDVQDTIVTSGDQDDETRYMKDCLNEVAAPKSPRPRIICLYGNCAVGKSSLINTSLTMEGASLWVSYFQHLSLHHIDGLADWRWELRDTCAN